jgi:23S rRNA (uracil1939-C5)-methyltransferase
VKAGKALNEPENTANEPENTASGPQTVEVRVERMVGEGRGIAFTGGRTVLVSGTMPGELVRAEVVDERGKSLIAKTVEVLEAAPERIEPPCPYLPACGGCDFQHIAYERQVEIKRDVIVDALRRVSGIHLETPPAMIASPKPFGYRTRAEWHLEAMTGNFGYHEAGSNRIVDVEQCPILEPVMNDVLARTRTSIRAGLTASIRYEAAAGDTDGNAFDFVGEPLPLTRTVGDFTYRFDPSVFFQANGALLDELVEEAMRLARSLPDGAREGLAIDLYSGVGLFSLALGRVFGTVIGVEESARAVKYAKRNANRADLPGVTFHALETRRFLHDQRKVARRAGFVVMDPPRTGLDDLTRASLIVAKIPAMTYVSCDPATLARDLKPLRAAGYRIESVTGIDMFPQTHHVETVVHLTLPPGK